MVKKFKDKALEKMGILSHRSQGTSNGSQTVVKEASKQDGKEKLSSISENIAKHNGALDNNPYLQSRALWNDLYGSAQQRYRSSRRLNQWLAGLLGLSLLGTIMIGMQAKNIPFWSCFKSVVDDNLTCTP